MPTDKPPALQMQHYWGRKAIMARIDINSSKTLYRMIREEHLPVFLRRKHSHPKPFLYTNEALIIAWEMAKVREYWATLSPNEPPKETISGNSKKAA